MVQFDFQARAITLKLVYYGPAMSGKTTNLQQIHARVAAGSRGRLMSLDTRDDRTLFFDLLPIHFRADSDFQLRLKIYTVPGQVMHEATRRLVLKGADGVAFIADSQRGEIQATDESFSDLQRNLKANALAPDQTPLVIQYNKRDLADIRSDAELEQLAGASREPIYKAVALRGEGVLETFFGLAALTWNVLEQKYEVRRKLGIDGEAFLQALHRHVGVLPEPAQPT